MSWKLVSHWFKVTVISLYPIWDCTPIHRKQVMPGQRRCQYLFFPEVPELWQIKRNIVADRVIVTFPSHHRFLSVAVKNLSLSSRFKSNATSPGTSSYIPQWLPQQCVPLLWWHFTFITLWFSIIDWEFPWRFKNPPCTNPSPTNQ